MIFSKIVKGYKSVFFGFITLFALVLVCLGAGFALSFPLWKLATENAGLYTMLSISLFLCGIFYLLVKNVIKAYKRDPRRLIISFFKKLSLILGLSLFVYFVLNFNKPIAVLSLVLMFIIYGFLAFVLPQSKNNNET